MQAVKAVRLGYKPTDEIFRLPETFRSMVDFCIHIGLEKGITSRFRSSGEEWEIRSSTDRRPYPST